MDFSLSRRTLLLASLPLLAVLCLKSAALAGTDIRESGSTLLYPVITQWAGQYMKSHPGVSISTLGSGSGAGITDAIAGVSEIGASDAFFQDQSAPRANLLNIPVAISAQVIEYNVPEARPAALRLSGAVLAEIYQGAVTMWDDKAILAINPNRPLPHRRIRTIIRAESSGDTYLFSQYLSLSSPQWNATVHYGTTIAWPKLDGVLEERGNAGVLQACQDTPYSLAYVGISYLERARAAGLVTALIRNAAGSYVYPTPTAVAAAAEARPIGDDGAASLILAPGAGVYPIVNIEYAIVHVRQSSADVAQSLRGFLSWIVDPSSGNADAFLRPAHFAPLTPRALGVSRREIAQIAGP